MVSTVPGAMATHARDVIRVTYMWGSWAQRAAARVQMRLDPCVLAFAGHQTAKSTGSQQYQVGLFLQQHVPQRLA